MFCGIDTHKRTLAACIVTAAGLQRAQAEFRNTPDGHAALLKWLAKHGVRLVGIEGTGSFGFVVTQAILEAGIEVVDVPANRTARARTSLARRGKTDPGDALAIARLTASGEPLAQVKRCPVARDLQLLDDRRRHLVRERVQLINRVHADLSILLPGQAPKLKHSRVALERAIAMITPTRSVRAELCVERLERLLDLIDLITAAENRVKQLLAESGSTLTELRGIGPNLAALIIGQTGNIDRYRTADQYAAANGTAPIPASSGQTNRYRLNRFGNRRINYAIHQMAIVQLRHDERAQTYVANAMSRGKSRKEAIRCLKRRLSDVVYRQMRADHLRTA